MLYAFIRRVLPAIQFDTRMQLLAIEIQNIRRDRVLTTKLSPGQLPSAQMVPEQSLSVGGFAPKLTSEFKLARFER